MGVSVSKEQIEAHLARQEVLIRQLHTVVEKQAKALERVGTGVDYGTGFKGAPKETDTALLGEVGGLEAAAKRAEKKKKDEDKITEDEKKKPNVEWSPPTADEERGFMATKPWLGAMAPPDGFKFGVTDGLPDKKLELEHVHGYRANGVRNNVYWVDSNTIVYFAAAVGIVHSIPQNKQKFFFGHTDDILCLAYHPTRKIVVTGEQGKTPSICVWDVVTQQQLARLAGFHKRGVVSVSFSDDGSRVASVGLDDDHSVAVYDWANGSLLASAKGSSERILDIQYNTTKGADSNNEFVTIGVKHVAFWTQANGKIEKEKGLLGNLGELQPFLTAAFTTLYTCVGTQGGEIYVFKANKLQKIVDAHQKSLFALKGVGDALYSGGLDGYVSSWNMNTFKKENSVNMNKVESPEVLTNSTNSVRAIDSLDGDQLIVGCVTSSLHQIRLSTGTIKTISQAHYGNLSSKENYGELWGLATAPSGHTAATAGEDSTLRIWDLDSRVLLKKIMLKDCGQCVAWSPKGDTVVVGQHNGSITVFDAKTWEEIRSIKKCKRRIQSLRFSPSGHQLAVGSADNVIDLYDTTDYTRTARCSGNSSVILHLDYSADGQSIQSCAQSYELLFYKSADGAQITNSRSLNNTDWATFTSILGWNVQGIWPKESDGSDVNRVCMSHSKKYLASAEDSGLIKLFNYPCVGGGLDKKGTLTRRPESHRFIGHSSHVTSVDWVADDSYVLSTGGADLCVFQWKVVNA